MLMYGVDVDRGHVEWLRMMVGEPTSSVLTGALDQNSAVVRGLDFDDRERILTVLDLCPAGLVELRDALLRERKYRRDQRI